MESAIRWSQSLTGKDGKDWMAYKFNLFYLQADDWVADNYEPVYDTDTDKTNPGGYDAVNINGDEYYPANDLSTASPCRYVGTGIGHRKGYLAIDKVIYYTQTFKHNPA